MANNQNPQQVESNYKKFITKYNMLCEFLEQNNNVYPNEKTHKQLFNWVRNTRRFCKNDQIEQRRVDLLKKIDFPFSTKTIIPFEKRIIQLLEYKKEHGSLHVSQTLYGRETENYKLSRWVNEMRRKFAENRLGYEYVVALNKIGFLWNMDDVRIEKKINALKRFHKKYGHFDIPQKGKYKKMGNWVAGLRSRGIKTKRHKKWLDDIGFVWVGVKERKRRSLEKMNEVDMKVMAERIKRTHRKKKD
ncbi:MAG: helicase associated domain-containing protein [Cyclobacteriaceae bacterium]|nr:helicase associated domain-containing protein [Cyclobacteriaceae bacterium]